MIVFDSDTITHFSQAAEDAFVASNKCIIDRLSLNIVSGTSIYTLPDYVHDIRRITWKGVKLDPTPHRQFREQLGPVSAAGRPYWYIFNNIGKQQIKLYPAPNENIAANQFNLYSGSAIENRVIVEFYRFADYTIFTIPQFLRRRLLKAYVLKMCFAIEGPGQNLSASDYFDKKWQILNLQYGTLLNDLINKPRKLIMGGNFMQSTCGPAAPRLPIGRYGVSIDDY